MSRGPVRRLRAYRFVSGWVRLAGYLAADAFAGAGELELGDVLERARRRVRNVVLGPPQAVLWGARAGDWQIGGPEDRRRQVALNLEAEAFRRLRARQAVREVQINVAVQRTRELGVAFGRINEAMAKLGEAGVSSTTAIKAMQAASARNRAERRALRFGGRRAR